MANTVKRKVDEYEKPADAVAYDNALKNLERPNEINSTHLSKMNDIIGKIESREPFTYDINADMLYQQYKDAANRNGNLAMQDTIGKASAMTGGYGNSYAQQVGQQTYNNYMQQLNDKIPELYQLAYDKYNQEGNQLKDLYSLYGNAYAREYGEYRDKLTDYNNERAYLTNAAQYADNTGYSRYQDALSRADAEKKNNQSVLAAAMSMGYKPTEQELADAGLNSGIYNAYADTYNNSKKKEEQQDLLGWIANGYEPRTSELIKVGIDPEKYNALKASQTAAAQPKEIVPGSDAYAAIMSDVDGATSIGDLADIVTKYVALGYGEDAITAMAAGKAKELEKKETRVLPKGASHFTDFFKK